MRMIIPLALIAAQALPAKQILAVTEIIPAADAPVSLSEAQHLTNELRRQAGLALPQEGYTVLTRENLLRAMPEDEREAERLAESSVIDMGIAIGAGVLGAAGAVTFFF